MNKVNILMVTNSLYPNLSANSEIVYRLADVLSNDFGCHVSIMGINNNFFQKDIIDKYDTIVLKSVSEHGSIVNNTNNKILRWLKLLVHPAALQYGLLSKRSQIDSILTEYKRTIENVLDKHQIDCIIGFSEPYVILSALAKVQTYIPYISYKLDPWSTHYLRTNDPSAKKEEYLSDTKAASIIMTNYVYEATKSQINSDIMPKIKVLELPNILNYGQVAKGVVFDKTKINCVFAGGLYKNIRNPAYTLKLFESFSNHNIILHIFGHENNGKSIPDKLPDNIIYHGQVDSTIALSCMSEADILVNIGNTVTNQMPSKVLTYISFGKPILNVIKTNECPSLQYISKYPIGLSILEKDTIDDNDIECAERFCIASYGKQIEYHQIEQLYKSCTPRFVGEELYKIIQECIK